jgi:hypothetical protein
LLPKGLAAIRVTCRSLAETGVIASRRCDIRKPLRGVYRRMFPATWPTPRRGFRELAVKHRWSGPAPSPRRSLIVELNLEFHTSGEFRPVIDSIEGWSAR